MSTVASTVIDEASRIVASLPPDKAQALLEYARFLAERADEEEWDRRFENPKYQDKFRIPVTTQGRTLDGTVTNLREAVALHLEGEDLSALGLASDPALIVTGDGGWPWR
ncbi:MAG: hypothetical protein HY608_01135 [Planctomycetes bacterium]|nr:hypothetical protein [Planctomycetota bacterium]